MSPKINFLDKNEDNLANFKLREVPKDEVNAVVAIVEKLFAENVEGKIKSEILSHEIFNEELKRPDLGEDSLRHLHQASSMLGILKSKNFVNSETAFVDLGAGRGQTSFWLTKMIESEGLEESKVVVIDRASHRFKRDNKVDDRNLVERIKVDIGDLDLSKFDFGKSKVRLKN